MEYNKIIFTGPVGSGKTTAISMLSDVPTIKTEASASDMTSARKNATTVALDFGVMELGRNSFVHLYGTPGQERFDFMWEILTRGGVGLVLLLDNTRADPFRDLRFFTQAFDQFIRETGFVIGVTRMDIKPSPGIEEYCKRFYSTDFKPPIFEVDARQRRDVTVLVEALLYCLDPGLSD
jgi:signal recognition particle receptor subunit beta